MLLSCSVCNVCEHCPCLYVCLWKKQKKCLGYLWTEWLIIRKMICRWMIRTENNSCSAALVWMLVPPHPVFWGLSMDSSVSLSQGFSHNQCLVFWATKQLQMSEICVENPVDLLGVWRHFRSLKKEDVPFSNVERVISLRANWVTSLL